MKKKKKKVLIIVNNRVNDQPDLLLTHSRKGKSLFMLGSRRQAPP